MPRPPASVVFHPRLCASARAVCRAGELGVVSGTALDVVCARRLQLGDPGGHMRRALAAFPIPAMARRVMRAHYVHGGKAADASFELLARRALGQVPDYFTVQSYRVLVERRFKHPVLHKLVRSSKKYRAHDENNQFKIGDVVRIEECAPISKTKRWTVLTGDAS